MVFIHNEVRKEWTIKAFMENKARKKERKNICMVVAIFFGQWHEEEEEKEHFVLIRG